MDRKHRLSATVDEEMLQAARSAVEAGTADSVSAWVNEALHRQADHDRQLAALGDFIADYEREHGQITDEEIEQATRSTRARAVVVRGSKKRASTKRVRRAS